MTNEVPSNTIEQLGTSPGNSSEGFVERGLGTEVPVRSESDFQDNIPSDKIIDQTPFPVQKEITPSVPPLSAEIGIGYKEVGGPAKNIYEARLNREPIPSNV